LLAVTLADLWFRARQFLIAVLGVGLTLALALSLSGLADGFHAEAEGAIDSIGASSFVMASGAHGRFTAFAAFPESVASSVAAEPGVRRASPILFAPGQVLLLPSTSAAQTVNLVGVRPGGLGDPAVSSGHQLDGTNQAVVDSKLAAPLGTVLHVGGHAVRVVGTVDGRTLTGGVPLVYVPLPVVQHVVTGGKPLITAIATTGTPTHVPAGFVVLSPATVVTDTVGQLRAAVASIDNTRWLMWILAAAIVASMLYVAALERKRDFAVLKALGCSSGALFFSLVLEAVFVTLLAALLAEVLSAALTPIFSQPVDITTDTRLLLPLIAVVVGIVASVSALRRVTGADPATAFG
jgi:putative ABC transport system permease protein